MATDGTIPVIDLFAGPGGLGEGFTRVLDHRGRRVFRLALSIEMDEFAHRTLRLRSFFRQFPPGEVPDAYYRYLRGEDGFHSQELLFEHCPTQAAAASFEAWRATLGETSAALVSERVSRALRRHPKSKPWIMIGGPPCQAYSLVGRARMLGDRGHQAFYEDARHTLYREYLRLIRAHEPTAFIMETVKGRHSARPNASLSFNEICADLRRPTSGLGYRLVPLRAADDGLFGDPRLNGLVEPEQFLIHSESYGIPQSRHRLIIVGIRGDFAAANGLPAPLTRAPDQVPCRRVIDDLPALRSALSREKDSPDAWMSAVQRATSAPWIDQLRQAGMTDVAKAAIDA